MLYTFGDRYVVEVLLEQVNLMPRSLIFQQQNGIVQKYQSWKKQKAFIYLKVSVMFKLIYDHLPHKLVNLLN